MALPPSQSLSWLGVGVRITVVVEVVVMGMNGGVVLGVKVRVFTESDGRGALVHFTSMQPPLGGASL